MATPRTHVSERTTRSKPTRETTLSFISHAINVRNENPDPFEEWSPRAIARALLDRGVLNHENVMLELAERVVQMSRRELDPNFDMEVNRRTPSTPAETPRRQTLVAAVIGDLNARTIMRDGRPLGEWTFGEFRTEYKGMGAIILQFAGIPDDELIGDHLN